MTNTIQLNDRMEDIRKLKMRLEDGPLKDLPPSIHKDQMVAAYALTAAVMELIVTIERNHEANTNRRD